MVNDIKKQIINEIIKTEGGYVDNPNDSGGKTNFGITERVARDWGYDGDMKYLPRETAFDIYDKIFWQKLRLDDILENGGELIAREIADTAVNMGHLRAISFLQRSLNLFNKDEKYFKSLLVDGAIGDKTIHALSKFYQFRGSDGVEVLHKTLNILQGMFYIELAERREKDKDFVYGWIKNRVKI